jgi:hypothetical protein
MHVATTNGIGSRTFLLCKIKQIRAIAARYDKMMRDVLAARIIWLN